MRTSSKITELKRPTLDYKVDRHVIVDTIRDVFTHSVIVIGSPLFQSRTSESSVLKLDEELSKELLEATYGGKTKFICVNGSDVSIDSTTGVMGTSSEWIRKQTHAQTQTRGRRSSGDDEPIRMDFSCCTAATLSDKHLNYAFAREEEKTSTVDLQEKSHLTLRADQIIMVEGGIKAFDELYTMYMVDPNIFQHAKVTAINNSDLMSNIIPKILCGEIENRYDADAVMEIRIGLDECLI